MQVPRRVLWSPDEVGGMSQLQHDETKTILFHRKYYHDSISIFDYLILSNDNSIVLKNCAPFTGGLGLLIAGFGKRSREKT